MKLLTPPYVGFMMDTAQVLYLPLNDRTAATDYSIAGEALSGSLTVGASSTRQFARSLYDPTESGTTAAWRPTSAVLRDMWFTSSQAYAPGAQVQSNWSIALHYSVVSAATQCLFSRESGTALTAAAGLNFRLFWTQHNSSWNLASTELVGLAPQVKSQPMPESGMVGLTREMLNDGTGAILRWYHNGVAVGLPQRMSTPGVAIGTSASARYQLGNSAAAAGSYTTVSTSFGWAGTVDEVGVWADALSPAKMLSLYGQSVKNYDDNDLLASGGQETRYRVMLESTNSGTWLDMGNHDGVDWVQSVRVNRAVSEDTTIAVSLTRYRGRYANLSPLATEADYAGLLKLRRRLIVLRAVTPRLVEPKLHDFRFCAEGFIESWEYNGGVMNIAASDNGAPMRDNFIVDPRAYNFPTVNKSAEEHQQQIVDDIEPKIKTPDAVMNIGYKGGRPIVYSPSGNPHTPTFGRTGQTLRFNDVGTGNVAGALQAVSDQIGAECRFMLRDDVQADRLLSYTPRRDKSFTYSAINVQTGKALVDVETNEPHGLNIGSTVSLSGTASHNFIGVVSAVTNWFRFRVSVASGYSPHTSGEPTNGSMRFDFNLALKAEDIFSVDPIKAEASSIRNHTVVRFQRNETTTTGFGSIEKLGPGTAKVVLNGSRRVPNIDPENLGISFTISGATSTFTPFNASYSGKITGYKTITSNEIVPTLIVGAFTTSIYFSTQNQAYQEVVSTATTSVEDYGYMPAAIFEGATLGINTETEAQRLADNVTSDLSEPTYDFRISTRPLPLELHDVVQLPEDPKRRWSGVYIGAVVSVEEGCDGGKCSATYGIRYSKPTLGPRWASRIVSTWETPVLVGNYNPSPVEDAFAVKFSTGLRRFDMSRRGPSRREAGHRHDRTVVWGSTASGFIPTEANKLGEFRGDNLSIANDGDGNRLSPGTRYYIRTAQRDIFGNLSQIQGLNAATAASQFMLIPRYTEQSAAVYAIASSVSTATANRLLTALGAYVLSAGLVNSTDAASLSFDVFGNRSAFSPDFQCPTSGDYQITHRSAFSFDHLKVNDAADLWHVSGYVLRTRGTATTAHSVTSAYFIGNGNSLRFFNLSTVVSCNSGDRLAIVADSENSSALHVRASSLTTAFTGTKFTLISQDP